MMSRDYKCFKCGKEFMELYENSEVAKNSAICSCGHKAKRLYGCQVVIDNWTPEGKGDMNDAQRDIEHFEKKRLKGTGRAIYQENEIKEAIVKQRKQDYAEGKIQEV